MTAIMLHYFHGGPHAKSQGSISSEGLFAFIEKRGTGNLLSAQEWEHKFEQGKLKESHYCLTFDDNLKCQIDIALPVLEHFNKTAFWFVYTNPYVGGIDRLELYRYFRNTFFNSVDHFYEHFYEHARTTHHRVQLEKGMTAFPEGYLNASSFYSRSDRMFRFVRDQVLGSAKYFEIMDSMIEHANLDIQSIGKNLWLAAANVAELAKKGHRIGLHSHTHPTQMAQLSKADQLREYEKNLSILSGLTKKEIRWMSHPCNSYNHETLEVLQSLGIEYGFRADSKLEKYSKLELPRVDSADIISN